MIFCKVSKKEGSKKEEIQRAGEIKITPEVKEKLKLYGKGYSLSYSEIIEKLLDELQT